jgi:hypothetical protein
MKLAAPEAMSTPKCRSQNLRLSKVEAKHDARPSILEAIGT